MKAYIDRTKRIAEVWMSHADQASAEKQAELEQFLADCREKQIYVAVFRSGNGDLLENTKDLLTCNYSDR